MPQPQDDRHAPLLSPQSEQTTMMERRGSGSTQVPLLPGGAAAGQPAAWRVRLYELMEPNHPMTAAARAAAAESKLTPERTCWQRAGLWLENCLVLVILANVATFILGTCDFTSPVTPLCGVGRCCPVEQGSGLPGGNAGAARVYDTVETATVVVFTVEYVLRLGCIGLNDQFGGWRGLLRFVATPFALVDLAAILPFYIDVVYNPGQNDIPALQFVRLLRLLRILLLGEYATAFATLGTVRAWPKPQTWGTGSSVSPLTAAPVCRPGPRRRSRRTGRCC